MEPTFGQLAIKIDGTNDYLVLLHLSQPKVQIGQRVRVGDLAALSGRTSPDPIGPICTSNSALVARLARGIFFPDQIAV